MLAWIEWLITAATKPGPLALARDEDMIYQPLAIHRSGSAIADPH